MNIREKAIELLQVFAQLPPPTEDAKLTTLELIFKEIYDQGYKDGGDGEPTVIQENQPADIPAMKTELIAYLDQIPINSENIGALRRSLSMPFDCEWNAWVRDLTAERENK